MAFCFSLSDGDETKMSWNPGRLITDNEPFAESRDFDLPLLSSPALGRVQLANVYYFCSLLLKFIPVYSGLFLFTLLYSCPLRFIPLPHLYILVSHGFIPIHPGLFRNHSGQFRSLSGSTPVYSGPTPAYFCPLRFIPVHSGSFRFHFG